MSPLLFACLLSKFAPAAFSDCSGDVAMDLVYGVVPPVTRVQLGLRLVGCRFPRGFLERVRLRSFFGVVVTPRPLEKITFYILLTNLV